MQGNSDEFCGKVQELPTTWCIPQQIIEKLQEELAERAGYHRTYIGQQERGETSAEFWPLLSLIEEPFRTMVLTAQCLGLRVSEVMALQ